MFKTTLVSVVAVMALAGGNLALAKGSGDVGGYYGVASSSSVKTETVHRSSSAETVSGTETTHRSSPTETVSGNVTVSASASTTKVKGSAVVKNTVVKHGGSGVNTGGRPASRAIRTISGNTFTIERESALYKVTVLPNTIIINSKGKHIPFSSLKVGHQVQVIGDFKPSNTNAQWVKDLSI